MAVNFPDHPAVDDTFVNGAVTYKWDGVKWTVVGSSGGGGGGGTFTGGTLTTPLILAADPAANLEAATKQYVDAHAGGGSYTLPAATTVTRGGVTVDGITITASGDKISASAPTLPVASPTVSGIIKPDGTTISIDGGGVAHANTSYTLPPASATSLGGVKVDNVSITANVSGVISATVGALPTASPTILGAVKIDNSSITIANGVISAKGAAALNAPNSVNTMTSTADPLDYLAMFDASANAVMWLPISVGSDGITDLTAAGPITDGTQFWVNQGGAADVSATGLQLATYTRGQSLATVPITKDTTLNYSQHNGRRLYATVNGITISAPSGAGALQDGFNSVLTNISGNTIALANSITLLPGTSSTMLDGTQVDISVTTAGGAGTVVYAAARGSGGSGSTAAPNTPTSLTLLTHSQSSLQVGWQAPTGPVPTSYTLQYQKSGDTTWITVPSIGPTNYTIGGLLTSTTYFVEVAAANSLGSSPFTSPLSAATDASLAAPGVPTSLVNSARGSTTLTITWSPPASGGTVATYNPTYVLHSGGTPTVASVPGTQFSYTFTGLTAATAYDLSITSTNATSTSSAASLANISTLNLPAQVTGLSHTAETSTTVTLAWSAATGATSYHIQYRVSSPVGAWQDAGSEPSTLSFPVSGLVQNRTYDFQVAGKNSDGIGTYSSTVTDTTASSATATVTAPNSQMMARVDAGGVVVTFANTSTVYAVPWTGSAEVGSRIAVTVSGSTVTGLQFPSAIATAIATIRVYSASTAGSLLAESTAFTVVPFSATRVFTDLGTQTWFPPVSGDPGYAPAGTQITWEAWGGGSGGSLNGGGGGGYSSKTSALTSADVTNGITVVIGSGSNGASQGSASVAAGASSVTGSGGIIVSAQGGHIANAAASTTGGGAATSGTGTTKFSGGGGGNSGGGGGAAGKDGAGGGALLVGGDGDNHLGGAGGGNATTGAPGTSNVEGGGGGARTTSTAQTGGDGGAPGGGGGGANVVGGGGVGGDGARGQVRLSYTPAG